MDVIRSEEELQLSSAWRPVERIRVRKRVVTEERTVTLALRREELVVESETVAAGPGRARWYPWASSHPRARRRDSWSAVSTPSATTRSPRACAMATTAATMAVSLTSLPSPSTKDLSIFSSSSRSRLR